jgi:hypothetical protein
MPRISSNNVSEWGETLRAESVKGDDSTVLALIAGTIARCNATSTRLASLVYFLHTLAGVDQDIDGLATVGASKMGYDSARDMAADTTVAPSKRQGASKSRAANLTVVEGDTVGQDDLWARVKAAKPAPSVKAAQQDSPRKGERTLSF